MAISCSAQFLRIAVVDVPGGIGKTKDGIDILFPHEPMTKWGNAQLHASTRWDTDSLLFLSGSRSSLLYIIGWRNHIENDDSDDDRAVSWQQSHLTPDDPSSEWVPPILMPKKSD